MSRVKVHEENHQDARMKVLGPEQPVHLGIWWCHEAAEVVSGVSMSASRPSAILAAATLTEFRPRCAYRAVVCNCV